MQTASKTRNAQSALYSTRHPFSCALIPTYFPVTPTTYSQAAKSPHWTQAMNEEFQALKTTNTWSLVPYHPSYNVIGCFHQQACLYFTETFSLVAKPTTIRLILSLVVQFDWSITQLDVSNAFLHGTLHEEVYMQQPLGFINPLHPTHICRLHKSLYGLKQAPRSWYEELYHSLLGIGFVSSSVDPSLFIKADTTLTFILVYVDDILIIGNSLSYCQSLIHQLSSQFSMKNPGLIHYFLSIQVQCTTDSIFLSQSKYLHDILAKAHMLDAKPCSTPSSTTKFETTTDSLMPDPTTYRSLVGAIRYLTWTQPDIAFAVNTRISLQLNISLLLSASYDTSKAPQTMASKSAKDTCFSLHFSMQIGQVAHLVAAS
ncbi:unnamed protein product [Prunus brigantina]